MIELPFGDIEVAVSGRVRIVVRRHGDSSRTVRYAGSSLTLAELRIGLGDDDGRRDEFTHGIDSRIAHGYRGSPDYVVDTRPALTTGRPGERWR